MRLQEGQGVGDRGGSRQRQPATEMGGVVVSVRDGVDRVQELPASEKVMEGEEIEMRRASIDSHQNSKGRGLVQALVLLCCDPKTKKPLDRSAKSIILHNYDSMNALRITSDPAVSVYNKTSTNTTVIHQAKPSQSPHQQLMYKKLAEIQNLTNYVYWHAEFHIVIIVRINAWTSKLITIFR